LTALHAVKRDRIWYNRIKKARDQMMIAGFLFGLRNRRFMPGAGVDAAAEIRVSSISERQGTAGGAWPRPYGCMDIYKLISQYHISNQACIFNLQGQGMPCPCVTRGVRSEEHEGEACLAPTNIMCVMAVYQYRIGYPAMRNGQARSLRQDGLFVGNRLACSEMPDDELQVFILNL